MLCRPTATSKDKALPGFTPKYIWHHISQGLTTNFDSLGCTSDFPRGIYRDERMFNLFAVCCHLFLIFASNNSILHILHIGGAIDWIYVLR